MLQGATRKLDLYDLFSILLPGGAIILALLPFLPQNLVLAPTILLSVIVFTGYVAGRALHSFAVHIEDAYESIPTHRERFVSEIKEPETLSKSVIHQFCIETSDEFDFFTPRDQADEIDLDAVDEDELDDLYSLVRSYIHIDSRGRSRSFQAVYSFYRGMWIASIAIALLYFVYGFLSAQHAFEGGFLYTSYIGALNINPAIVMYVPAVVAYTAHYAFRIARENYQHLYVQYLIADFLILQGVDYPEAIVMAEKIDE